MIDYQTTVPKNDIRGRFLAIDPGDVHVGAAEFVRYKGEPWRVAWANELTPTGILKHLYQYIPRNAWDCLVVEEWRLFPEQAPRSVGSDMPSARLIGGIQTLAKLLPDKRHPLELHLQTPQIKVPTRSWLARRGLKSVAKLSEVSLDHATDAELHGYRYLINSNQQVWNQTEQDQVYAGHPGLSKSHVLW